MPRATSTGKSALAAELQAAYERIEELERAAERASELLRDELDDTYFDDEDERRDRHGRSKEDR